MKKASATLAVCALALAASLPAHATKRGFGGPLQDAADLAAAARFDWYYDWGQQPSNGIIDDNAIEYAPMAWNGSYNREQLIAYLIANPQVKYLLAFNEPNFLEQASMTPTQAAAAWPELEAIADRFDLIIVGPALNFSWSGGAVVENGVEYTDPVKWYDDFFAACTGCRVDHIAIHGYFDNAAALPWYINLFDKYKKPMWLTEFNLSPAADMEAQKQYMREAIPILENDPRIFRYAWFLSRSSQLNTNLFEVDQTGVLTELGELYGSLPAAPAGPQGFTFAKNEGQTVNTGHPVDVAYGANGSYRYLYGVNAALACDTPTFGGDPSFGMAKFCFVRNAGSSLAPLTIQAENLASSFGVQAEPTSDTGGGSSLGWIDATDWMQYDPITVASAGSYSVQFRVATPNTGQKFVLSDAINGQTLATVTLPNTGGWQNWTTVKTRVKLPAGTTQFRITALTSGFNLNWLVFKPAQ